MLKSDEKRMQGELASSAHVAVTASVLMDPNTSETLTDGPTSPEYPGEAQEETNNEEQPSEAPTGVYDDEIDKDESPYEQTEKTTEDERNEDPIEAQSSTPTTDERSAQDESITSPPATPLTWKEAAKAIDSPMDDVLMPSFTDKAMLDQIEVNAKQSASNLVVLVHHLRTQLATITSLSVQYMNLHKSAIEGVSEHVQQGIDTSQKLIIKAQALNAELRRVYAVQQDIKETKKLLSQLEKQVERITKS